MSLQRKLAMLAVALALSSAAPNSSAAQSKSAPRDLPRYPDINLAFGSRGGMTLAIEFDRTSPEARFIVDGVNEATGCSFTTSVDGNKKNAPCYVPMRLRRPWVRELDIDLNPVRKQIQAIGMPGLWIGIELPESAFHSCTLCQPATPPPTHLFSVYVNGRQTGLARLYVAYGYRWFDLWSVFGPLAAVPILLVVLTLWMRRYALRSAAVDPEAAWFSYARFMKLGTQAAWLLSLGLFSLPAIARWVEFAVGSQTGSSSIEGQVFVWALIAVLPMSVATIVCRTLSYPVFAQVHGSLWTRGEIFRLAFWTQAAFAVPTLCFAAAFPEMRDENWRAVMFLLLLGFGALFFGKQQVAAASGRTPESLNSGELRDRVFQLAATAGVKLKSLYVISSAKSRMANAFAARGNIVMVTDYLLTRLTRREVDAIVAHELTHLKSRHIALRAVILAAVFYISIGIILERFHMQQIPVLVGIALLIFYLISRINERSADAGAVKITGDPEAMITALVKATRLNKFPLRWSKLSEWLMTHPSTMRRAEAIARKAAIAPARLAEILREGSSGDSYYTLPPAIASKVFSTKYKRRQAAKRSWTFLAIMTAMPAAILGIANATGFHGAAFLAAWVLSVVATFALYLLAMNYLSLSGNVPLEKRLRAKLKSENTIAREDAGSFVSLAPDAVARLCDGSFSWDIGLLYVGAEKIVYVGEETRFALRRQDITEIQSMRGAPAWIPTRAVLIRWSDPSRNRIGALLLRPQAVRTLGQQSDAADELAARLEEWLDGRQSATDELPTEEFGTPVIGAVTSISPAQLAGGRTAARSLMITGYIAAAAAVLCNLSFTWPLDGWFAVLATMILAVVQFVPYWRYREGTR